MHEPSFSSFQSTHVHLTPPPQSVMSPPFLLFDVMRFIYFLHPIWRFSTNEPTSRKMRERKFCIWICLFSKKAVIWMRQQKEHHQREHCQQPFPQPTQKTNQGLEQSWCAVLQWIEDGFRFHRWSARPSGRKTLVVITPLRPTDRFLDWARVPDQRVLWVKWYISTRNTFCGHFKCYLGTLLSAPSGSVSKYFLFLFTVWGLSHKSGQRRFMVKVTIWGFPTMEALSACTWL